MHRATVLVVALLIWLPSAPALPAPTLFEPPQDDAGSGRDAGEGVADAVPVVPGRLYHGNLTTPLGRGSSFFGDDADSYLFEAPSSVVLRGAMWTEGAVCMHVYDAADVEVSSTCAALGFPVVLETALPAGTYILAAEYFDPAPYRFSFTLDGSTPPADPAGIDALASLDAPVSAPLAPPTPATQDGDHVVVAIVDTGINPYHDLFAAPALVDHPSLWLPGFPADARTVELTLDEPDLATARAADDAAWRGIERADGASVGGAGVPLYTFPGTRVVGAVSFGEYVSAADGQLTPPPGARPVWDDQGHGTHSAGLAAGANISGPDGNVLVVMVEVAGGDFLRGAHWAAQQPWIDVISVSAGSPANHPLDVVERANGQLDMGQVARQATLAGKTFFTSSGNGIDPLADTPERCVTYTSVAKGSEWLVRVGAAMPETKNPAWWHCVPADVLARTFVPSPDTTSTSGMSEAGGTSASSPNAAGHFAQLVLRLEREGLALPQRETLQHLLNASEHPEPGVEFYAAPSVRPLSPIVEGYGVIDEGAVERAFADILAGAGPRPRPDMDAWLAVDREVRHRLYHEEEGVFSPRALVPADDGGSGRDATEGDPVPVEPGRTYAGSGAALDDGDVFWFDAQAGDLLRFHDLSANCWSLRMPDGTSVTLDCFSWGGQSRLPSAGRYFLDVNALVPGPYWFSFTLDGSDPPPANPTPVAHPSVMESLEARQDDAGTGRDAPPDLDAAFWIGPETVVHGMTDVFITDSADAYRFHATQGDVLQLKLRAPIGNVIVYGPGQEAAASTVVVGDLVTTVDVPVDRTGTWYVSWEAPTGVDYAFVFGLDGSAPDP